MKIVTLQERHERDQYRMLCEAMDQDKLYAISKAFEKLDNILRNINIPSIESALEKARTNAHKLLSGDQGFLQKALGAIGVGGSGKIVQQVMNTQIQLANMLRSLPKILVVAGRDMQQQISQNPEVSAAEAFGDKAQAVQKMVMQSLKPKMLEGGLAINPQIAAQEIMELTGKDFLDLMNRAKTSNFKVPVDPEDAKPDAKETGVQKPENPGKEHVEELLQALRTTIDKDTTSKILAMTREFIGDDLTPQIWAQIWGKLAKTK